MSYKYFKGSTVQGDIKAADDPERNTLIDFEDDYIGLITSGSTIFVVSGSNVGIGTTTPDYTLDVDGTVGVSSYIYHNGDNNTYLYFQPDSINLVAGSKSGLKIDKGAGKIYLNNTNADMDVQIMAEGGDVLLHTDAEQKRVGIGTNSPTNAFHVYSPDTIGFKFEGDDHCIIKLDGSNGSEKTVRFYEGASLKWMVGMDNSPNEQDDCFTIKSNNNNTQQQPEFLIDEGTGNVGFGTGIPTSKLDINSDSIRLRATTTPASATAAGETGQICWDADYIYVCVSGGTAGNAQWKRTALTTW